MPVSIANAALRLPAAVSYAVTTLSGAVPSYIAENSTAGFLLWDLQAGDTLSLDVPINWANVSYQTEVRRVGTPNPKP